MTDEHYKQIIATHRCPKCSAAPGEHCKTFPPPGRRIYPPHEARRKLSGGGAAKKSVETRGTRTGRVSSSEKVASNVPKEAPRLRRTNEWQETLGSDPIFGRYFGFSPVGEPLTHLSKREEKREALCGADVRSSFNRFADQKREFAFQVCVKCLTKVKEAK